MAMRCRLRDGCAPRRVVDEQDPVAMAVLAAGDEVARRPDLRQAIPASDDAAAERLWSSLGSGGEAASAATAQLRRAGDGRTVVQSRRLRPGFTSFGQTGWRLSDQARFAAGMSCLREGRYVLDLMKDVVAAQRWGSARRARRRSSRAAGGPAAGLAPLAATLIVRWGSSGSAVAATRWQSRPLPPTVATGPGSRISRRSRNGSSRTSTCGPSLPALGADDGG